MTGDERDEDFDYGDMPTDQQGAAFLAGWRAGREAAAQWHDNDADYLRYCAKTLAFGSNVLGALARQLQWTEAAARAIRAMKPPHNP